MYTADLQTYAAEARQLRLGAMAPPSDAGDLVAVTYYDYADPDVASAVKSGITARQPVYSAIDALVQSATVVFEPQATAASEAVAGTAVETNAWGVWGGIKAAAVRDQDAAAGLLRALTHALLVVALVEGLVLAPACAAAL